MNNKTLTGVIVIVLVIVGGFIYFKKPAAPTGPIKIGFVVPLTGDAATYGEPMKNAASIAVKEINDAGGVDGRQIEVIYEDSKCNGKDALTAVQKLISIDQVQIIDGFTCAEDILSAASVIEQNKVIALAPGASGPNVTTAGDYIFQGNPSATLATRQLAALMYKDYKKVAVISEQTAFATDITNLFVKEFEALGGQVVGNESYSSETRDFRSLITKIKPANPEAIFVNPQTEIAGGTIIKQIRELGIKAPLFGMDTVSGPKTTEIAGVAAIEGLTIVAVPGLSADNKKAQDFLAKYQAQFGTPPFDLYLGASYDSIYLLAQAVKEVGENGTKIKNYLDRLEGYNGVIGTFSFDDNGDLEGINFTVKKIINSKLVDVK